MRLGIDLDGVVADFNEGWIRLYNQQFGADIPLDAVTSWGAPPRLTHFKHMGEFWDWSSDIEGRSLFWHLKPYPDAIPALEDLDRAGHDIVILTTKPPFAIWDTFEWIGHHRLPTTEVHILEEKGEVPCDIYLDDGPHHMREIPARRPDAIVCRFVRPWNRESPGTVPIESWEDFANLVAQTSRPSGSV